MTTSVYQTAIAIYNVKNFYRKNYRFDDIEAYLTAKGTKILEDANFQRFKPALNCVIKVKMSQDAELWKKPPNYVRAIAPTSDGYAQIYYYYFITNLHRLAYDTMELTLDMDVLNTFPQSEPTTYQSPYYIFSKKCLIQRRHRDRFAVDATASQVVRHRLNDDDDISALWESMSQNLGNVGKKITCILSDMSFFRAMGAFDEFTMEQAYATDEYDTGHGGFTFKVIKRKDGSVVYSATPAKITMRGDGWTYLYGVSFSNPTFTYDYLATDEFISFGANARWNLDEYSIVIEALDIGAFDFSDSAVFRNYFDYSIPQLSANITDSFCYEIFVNFWQFEPKQTMLCKRLIDRFPENLNPILFKSDVGTLYDGDGTKCWSLLYANENAPASGGDTEAQYINPVKLQLIPEASYKVNANGTASTVIIYPSTIGQDVAVLVTKATDASNNVKLTIGGTDYALSNIGQGTYQSCWLYLDPSTGLINARFHSISDAQQDYDSVTDVNGASSVSVTGSSGYYFARVTNRFVYSQVWGGLAQERFCGSWLPRSSSMISVEFVYFGGSVDSTSSWSECISDIDLTDSRLIKLIELPYAPFEFLVGMTEIKALPDFVVWSASDKCIQLADLRRVPFNYRKVFYSIESPFSGLWFDKTFTANSLTKTMTRSDLYESKMFASEFYKPKFVYDSFSFGFQLELVDINTFLSKVDFSDFSFNFSVSQNVQSKFLFTFDQYITDGYDTQDYNNILYVNRNNEKALYNNAYLNYLRAGYSYDKKTASENQFTRGIGIALSAVGAVASFASSSVTGGFGIMGGISLATSTTTQIINAVNSANQADRAIQQRLDESQRQSISVSTAEDLDLLKIYSGNKAKLVAYHPSEMMYDALQDLFYYCGYACYEYGKPSPNNRVNFDFIQAVVDFEFCTLDDEYATKIRECYADGVTHIHGTIIPEDDKENWENTIYAVYGVN